MNLDKLEQLARKHTDNCVEYIKTFDLMYPKECDYKDMARNSIENVDKELFGCYNDRGIFLGYNFYGK